MLNLTLIDRLNVKILCKYAGGVKYVVTVLHIQKLF